MRKAILCILVLIVCLTLPATVLAAGDSYIGPVPQYQYENGVLRISNGASVHWYCTIDGRASKDFTSVNTARAWGCGFLPRYRVVKVWMRVRGKGTEIGSLLMIDGRPAYHNLVNKTYYRVNVSDGKISELWA